jgi:plastocyanin
MFDQTGEYLIQCREYCGFSHYNMKAKLFVEPAAAAEAAGGTGGEETTTEAATTPTTSAKTTTPSTGQTAAVGTQQPLADTTTTAGTTGNATTAATSEEGSTQQEAAAGATLTILEGSSIQGNPDFEPDELKVKKGDTILVDNVDTMPHSVTNGESASDPNSAKIFDTSIIMGGESAELDTSNIDAGTHPFYCTVHPYMTGSLIVE